MSSQVHWDHVDVLWDYILGKTLLIKEYIRIAF
jgi:hypothetical protein